MPRFSEETLNGWRNPPSVTEETKLSNIERMVKECIKADNTLKSMQIKIFGQGSYVNDTNVRLNSDVDLNVQYKNGFYFNLPDGMTRSDFGLNNPSSYSASAFKNDVQRALVRRFGSDVRRKNKCLAIDGNTNRVGADVVPTWEYRRYSTDGSYVEGVRFFADNGQTVTNFPIQHIENGKEKNRRTQRRFKRLTRIYKRLRAQMVKDRQSVNGNITSFLLECLLWNVPDRIFYYETWTDRLKHSIAYLWSNTQTEKHCNNWCEVSGMLPLFDDSRKWKREDVNTYLLQLWYYLEY